MNKQIIRTLLGRVKTIARHGWQLLKKKRKNDTTSYYLCDDLITEIIERLPAKSLVRNRCLSKSWSCHIVDRGFIRAHALRCAKTPQKVIVRQRIHYMRDLEVVYTFHPEDSYTAGMKSVEFPWSNFHISGSCNGIICLHERKSINTPFILWNPSIGRKQTVPRDDYGNSIIGFGFDTMTDDYKIVGISCAKSDAQKAYIYSLKTHSWSESAFHPCPFSYVKAVSLACFFNQMLHWVVISEGGRTCIITFNLSSHAFGMISLPEPTWKTYQLTIVKGSLAVISTNDRDNTWIWVRRECDNVASWSKGFNLTSAGLEVDSFSKRDDFMSNNYLEDFEGYNPESGMRSRLVGLTDSSYIIDMDMCVESLELIDKETC